MKARLIDLKVVEELDVEYPPKPEIHRIAIPKIGMFASDCSELISMPLVDYKRHIYKLVLLRDANRKEAIYYVNYENYKEVMPFIDHIIREETEGFERREIDYRIEIEHLKDQIISLNSKWFVRLYKWFYKVFKGKKK